MKTPVKWFALCGFGAVALGTTLGATMQRAPSEKPVVTVYKSPT